MYASLFFALQKTQHFLFTVFLHSTATIKMFKNKGFREIFVLDVWHSHHAYTKDFAKILKNRREFCFALQNKKTYSIIL